MSIQAEITRLTEAKDGLAAWLLSQGVEIQQNALLNDLVGLLEGVSTGGGLTKMATVSVSSGTGVTLSSVRLFFNGTISAVTGNSHTCSVGSLMIITALTTGGNTQTNASPAISATGDLTTHIAYVYASNSSLQKGMGVFLILVNGSGAITLTRKTSTGSIM